MYTEVMAIVWAPGQRVNSSGEPELGIGFVKAVQADFISVEFPLSRLTRRYSPKNAPLKRALLSAGSRATRNDLSSFVIEEVAMVEGLAKYRSRDEWIWEHELSFHQQNLGAQDLFLSGQWSSPVAFDLRRQGWNIKARAANPKLCGLMGPRLSLLPHQLFIANTVASRTIPRVLLADEVGLGKTIEAGLILSSLHRSGRANRVLVIVPDALKTQWLAELYRRFNLLFTLLDEPRCQEEEKTQGTLTAFESSPMIICSLDLLMKEHKRLKQAVSAQWDLVIIDEAHHMLWNASDPSPAWLAARELSLATTGLLLLTATPRQHGLETQFGLLNLVDPERFSNFEEFKKEAAHLQDLSLITRDLVENKTKAKLTVLEERFSNDSDLLNSIESFKKTSDSTELISKLIDRHGPGRVLFRNRREKLKGFPIRKLNPHPLETRPKDLPADTNNFHKNNLKLSWLLQWLKDLKSEKALIICSTPERVKLIDTFLLEKSGIKRSLFHEDMELIERDRQAAWFADPKGSQILIASEIGGEGRNFQFCRHIVMLDLPEQPDLVEQRIGRLDRIGQAHDIQIHVPYFKQTREEVFFEIYNNGLSLFSQATAGLAIILERLAEPLQKFLDTIEPTTEKAFDRNNLSALVAKVKLEAQKYREDQEKNFDLLVDINSYNEEVGHALKEEIANLEQSTELEDYMSQVFEFFGIEEEDLDETLGLYKIAAHSLMFVENFPELDDEKTITFSRNAALAREEITFITYDHPMVHGALSLLLDKNLGQSSVARLHSNKYKQGAFFEFSFVLQVPPVGGLGLEAYLPPTCFQILLDHSGKLHPADCLLGETLKALGKDEDNLRLGLAKLKGILPQLLEKAEDLVHEKAELQIKKAIEQAGARMAAEEERLLYLQKVNASVSKGEILSFQKKAALVFDSLADAELQLDAIRMILCAPGEDSRNRGDD